ncbi:MAG: cytochrome c1 [Minwuiales bacterium]|nr:cytochrome c1 [Minwuiales bacterium]
MVRLSVLAAAAALAAAVATPVLAAGEAVELKDRDWPHTGIVGTYDRASVQRGMQIYKEVCAACHSLRFISFRNLVQIGFTEDQAKAIAAEFEVPAEPNEDGDTFDSDGLRIMRPAALFDTFPSPFPNDIAARAANGGALPPDLSLMIKARPNGENYMYSLLTGYVDPPADFEMADGMNYNAYYPGHQIAMAAPLFDDAVEYVDGTQATVSQMAYDVTNFLAWAAEPNLEDRHRIGLRVVIFLVILSFLLYATKRKVWADLH